MNFLAWASLIPNLLPLVISSVQAVAHLIQTIRNSHGLTEEEQDTLIQRLHEDLELMKIRVQNAPGPYDRR